MKKIGLLPTSFEVDRNEAGNITTRLLAEKFSTKYDTYIFTGNIRNKKKKEIYKNIKIIRYSKIYGFVHFSNFFGYLRAFITHIFASYLSFYKYKKDKIKLDLVIGFSASYLLVLRTLLFKFSNRHIKTIHVFKSESSFGKFKFKFLLNKLDLIVVQNENMQRELRNLKIKTNIELINSPIDTNKFIILNNKNKLKKKYGFQNKKIILYYGHFNRFKGVEYLINAFKLIKDKNVNLVLIPSNDSQKNNYNSLINNYIFENRIKIFSAKSNLIEILNISNMVVLPYPELVSTESNPSCIIESLSCGVPVITSDLSVLKNVFKNNILYSKPKDINSIAENIDLLLKNSTLRKGLIQKGIVFSKKFDIKFISEKYFNLIEMLINGK